MDHADENTIIQQPFLSTPLGQSYTLYIGLFALLAAVAYALKRSLQDSNDSSEQSSETLSNPNHSQNSAQLQASFSRFQTNYLTVYLIMMGADWMQGPYVYALYQSYGYDMATIGRLFIMGFVSSMLAGPLVGAAADKFGRKLMCVAFGVLYATACVCKHIPIFAFLVLGRILSGVAAAILFSSFESWMVKQHALQHFPQDWIKSTFALATSLNGFVAIAAGIVASFLAETWGPTTPFKASAVLLVIGSVLVSRTWSENYGDQHGEMHSSVSQAVSLLFSRKDPSLLLLGLVQSCFEGGMYMFVFMWTPALQQVSSAMVLLGWVFASYMLCITIGCSIFEKLIRDDHSIHSIAMAAFATAAIALAVPVVSRSLVNRLIAFFVFEVCCGIYFPVIGTLRSQIIPDKLFSTIMTIYRVPLNLIVASVLVNLNVFSQDLVFSICSGCMLCSLLLQYLLKGYSAASSQGKTPAGGIEGVELVSPSANKKDSDYEDELESQGEDSRLV